MAGPLDFIKGLGADMANVAGDVGQNTYKGAKNLGSDAIDLVKYLYSQSRPGGGEGLFRVDNKLESLKSRSMGSDSDGYERYKVSPVEGKPEFQGILEALKKRELIERLTQIKDIQNADPQYADNPAWLEAEPRLGGSHQVLSDATFSNMGSGSYRPAKRAYADYRSGPANLLQLLKNVINPEKTAMGRESDGWMNRIYDSNLVRAEQWADDPKGTWQWDEDSGAWQERFTGGK